MGARGNFRGNTMTYFIQEYNEKGDYFYIVASTTSMGNLWSNNVNIASYLQTRENLACSIFKKNTAFRGTAKEAITELRSRLDAAKGKHVKRTKYRYYKNLIRRIQFDAYLRNVRRSGIPYDFETNSYD